MLSYRNRLRRILCSLLSRSAIEKKSELMALKITLEVFKIKARKIAVKSVCGKSL